MNAFSQNWDISYSPMFRHIQDIHFHNPTDIVIVGGHPFNDSICYMAHSGRNDTAWWPYHDIFPGRMLRSLLFYDINNGIAVGDNEVLYKSYDGGKYWTLSDFNLDLQNRRINKLVKNNDNIIFAAGGLFDENGFLLCSSDSAQTWSLVHEWDDNEIYSIAVLESNRIVVCGNDNFINYSDDNGLTWSSVSLIGEINENNLLLHSIAFSDDNNGYICGGIQNQEDTVALILKTTDGGLTWSTSYLDNFPMLNDISTANDLIVFAVGNGGLILRSLDAGENWDFYSVEDAPAIDLFSVNFLNPFLGGITGRSGYVFVFRDSDVEMPSISNVFHDEIDYTSARINAHIKTGGENTDVYLCYGLTEELENEIYVESITGETSIDFSYNIEDLTSYEKYYYKIKIINSFGVISSKVQNFIAFSNTFNLTCLPATNITYHEASLRGSFNPSNYTGELYFVVENELLHINEHLVGTFSDSQEHLVSQYVFYLLSDVTHYFYMKYVTDFGEFWSDSMSFKTQINPGNADLYRNEDLLVSIYPNPFDTYLIVDAKQRSLVSVSLFDVIGKRVFYLENVLIEDLIKIDLSYANPGYYILQINHKDYIINKKIIKR